MIFINFKDILELSPWGRQYYVTQTEVLFDNTAFSPNITDRCLKSKSPVTFSGL